VSSPDRQPARLAAGLCPAPGYVLAGQAAYAARGRALPCTRWGYAPDPRDADASLPRLLAGRGSRPSFTLRNPARHQDSGLGWL